MNIKYGYVLVLLLGLASKSFCMEEQETVKLLSSGGKEFTITKAAAEESGTLKQLLREGFGPEEVIPLPQVSSEAMAVLATFLPLAAEKTNYVQAKNSAGEGAVYSKIHNTWLPAVERKDTPQLLELLKAAHYLDIGLIVEALVHTIARRASFYATSEDDYWKAQALRRGAIFMLDPAIASEHRFDQPDSSIMDQLHQQWLQPALVESLPRDLRRIVAQWVLTEYQLAEGEHAAGYSEGEEY